LAQAFRLVTLIGYSRFREEKRDNRRVARRLIMRSRKVPSRRQLLHLRDATLRKRDRNGERAEMLCPDVVLIRRSAARKL